jgi:hypothetical protein
MRIEDLPYVSDVAELRPPYKSPSVLARAKPIDRIDPDCRNFIARPPPAAGDGRFDPCTSCQRSAG